MLASTDNSGFITSDGPGRLASWRRKGTSGPFELAANLDFEAAFGTANSGQAVTVLAVTQAATAKIRTANEMNGTDYFVSGHESGRVLIWRRQADDSYQLANSVDVASPDKPANPWGIHNIRGLAVWRGDRIISGSEDGDLVAIGIPDGKILFRHRYNTDAKRGINALSVAGEILAVANCAVGSTDKNIWLFDLGGGGPTLVDAENLAIDPGRSQTFNFDVDLVSVPGTAGAKPTLNFFSSTEEGLIWGGRIEDNQLIVTGVTKVSPEGGAVMAVAPKGDFVAAAAYAIRLFRTD